MTSTDRVKAMHDRRRSLPPEELKREQDRSGHGKRNTYNHWFCRCGRCVEANTKRGRKKPRARVRDQKAERAARKKRPDLKQQQDRSGHGNLSTYTYWWCRCDRCRAANTRNQKKNRLQNRKWS